MSRHFYAAKALGLCLVLGLACLLTSCFEIREEIDIKKNGAGTYALVVDMSQSKAMIDMAMSMADTKSRMPLQEMDSSFLRGVARFGNMEGISNAKPVNNRQDYIFGMQFDFANIEALNRALNDVNRDSTNGPQAAPAAIYKFGKRTLERTEGNYMKALAGLNEFKANDENAEQMKVLLANATYAYVVRTEGKIRKFSNKQSELSYTGKELRYSASLSDVIEGRANFANLVKFK